MNRHSANASSQNGLPPSHSPSSVDKNSHSPVQVVRAKRASPSPASPNNQPLPDSLSEHEHHTKRAPTFSWWVLCLHACAVLAVCLYAHHVYSYLPPLPPDQNNNDPSSEHAHSQSAQRASAKGSPASHLKSSASEREFNAYTAYSHLLALTAVGERVVGSVANEQTTPSVILSRVDAVVQRAEELGVAWLGL